MGKLSKIDCVNICDDYMLGLYNTTEKPNHL
jgi:hypothetical protein